ncbi:MAG TPA: prepilin-type N-terminal cleavage/methylation domain-containing protein [Rariglobus sp.]|jgi:prepilin-type N-terminal cleavage/methylation domain-containing protein|nr:prepilin-type N-terminal cleavage/methylation domain-containing protein [Rariglobus sp.]
MKRAFTLLEILVALALTALVVVALNTFIFSMGELWGKNSDQRLFDRHVRAVSRFLKDELRVAALPPNGNSKASPFPVEDVRTQANGTETLLTFELPQGCKLFVWPGQPLPEVVCALSVRQGVGLVILWHSRLEKDFDDQPPRETIVSPLVTELTYDYYDDGFKNWKNQTTLQKDGTGQYLVPQRLHLKFVYRTNTQEVAIPIPAVTEGLPAF